MECAEEGCTTKCNDTHWGRIRAQEAGWFFRKDGNKAWCPNHTPDWVHYWRARKEAKG